MSAERATTLHVVSFEEAGECTLERIAREAVEGDRVLLLGPEAVAIRLRELGLHSSVEITRVGRVGGAFRKLPALSLGAQSVAYGPRARDVIDASMRLSGSPGDLPPWRPWHDGRRERLRRELGLAPAEFAVGVVGEPSEWIDMSFAIRALSMARVAGAPLRVVVSPRMPRIASLGAFFELAASGKPVVVDERIERPWDSYAALDAVILDEDGAASMPPECMGWRTPSSGGRAVAPQPMSPLPALWALSCGKPVFAHDSIDLGAHGGDPRVTRFSRDIAQLARELHARASSASAASR